MLFEYDGRTQQGRKTAGRMDGATQDSVASQLMSRGITPITIREVKEKRSNINGLNIRLFDEKVSTVDLIMFCRQMYTITKAGIPLTRGIRGLASGLKNETLATTLVDIADRLETGMTLSASLSRHPKIFDSLFVNMVRVGESTGNLDEIFKQIGFYIERDEETRKRIKSALRYPSFVSVALVMAVTAVNIWVIPAFADMFTKFGAELPLVTRFLIGMSYVFVHFWYLIFILVVGAAGGFIYYVRTDIGALRWGKAKLRLPVVGELIDRGYMARYMRSFSLMLSAGVPLNQSLSLCAAAIDNPYLAKKIGYIQQGVERGDTLLRTHEQAHMFTPLVLQMIAVGEESGQLENLLADVAEFYEREVDYDLKTLTDRIEPILIVAMAVFVAVLALGIFLPLWGMHSIQR